MLIKKLVRLHFDVHECLFTLGTSFQYLFGYFFRRWRKSRFCCLFKGRYIVIGEVECFRTSSRKFIQSCQLQQLKNCNFLNAKKCRACICILRFNTEKKIHLDLQYSTRFIAFYLRKDRYYWAKVAGKLLQGFCFISRWWWFIKIYLR